MQSISVLGLGAMGAALSRVLLQSGYPLTVWNRSAGRADALEKQGARVAPDPASAIRSSDVTIVCVDNYDVSLSLLDADPGAVHGKALIQLSTGSPKNARTLSDWAHRHGARYLDGAIMAFPEQIGMAETSIIASGDIDVFRANEVALRALAPALEYLGESVGTAAAQDCAVAAYFAGGLIGALHGALICETEGLPVDAFASRLNTLSPVLGGDIEHLGKTLAQGNFDHPYASLKTWSAAIRRLSVHARESGINGDFPEFATRLFETGVDRGLGDQEVSALIKVLRG
ncbi:NAD(P)-dependent oxidoreductase [Pseudomonas sp. NPDC090202]|uniref:NAD(P)-dependent oxidoreductase n=1 Tax=unclassified Pseudomonas TaxID=196821 RepID=UPI00381C5CED